MILQPDAEFLREDDHRLVRKAHAGRKPRCVAAHDIGFFVNFEAKAVTDTVRQSRQPVVRPERMSRQHGARRIVQAGAGGAQLCGIENRLLRLAFDRPGIFKGAVAALQLVCPRQVGMIAVDAGAGVHQNDVVFAEGLVAVSAMWQ